jgi:hypothetical protein
MYREVWSKAKEYVGIDLNPHSLAPTLAGDNRILIRYFDMDAFNIFDVDAYSSPWQLARYIVKNRRKAPFHIVLTSGEKRGMQTPHCNKFIRAVLGLQAFSDCRMLHRFHNLVVEIMIKNLLELRWSRKSRIWICRDMGISKMSYILIKFVR